jgi:hypothetical protein
VQVRDVARVLVEIVVGVELPVPERVVVAAVVAAAGCAVSNTVDELDVDSSIAMEVASMVVVVAVSAAMADAVPKTIRTATPAKPAVRALFVMIRSREPIASLPV